MDEPRTIREKTLRNKVSVTLVIGPRRIPIKTRKLVAKESGNQGAPIDIWCEVENAPTCPELIGQWINLSDYDMASGGGQTYSTTMLWLLAGDKPKVEPIPIRSSFEDIVSAKQREWGIVPR